MASVMHPGIRWDSVEASLMGETVHGPEAIVDRLRPDIFATQRTELIETETREGRIYIELRFHAEGSGSGIKVVTPAWQVWTLEEGLVVRVQNFLHRDEARAAAGLEAKAAE
jgi:hypothetical protein